MKFVIVLACLATFVVYSQAAKKAYGAACDSSVPDTCDLNGEVNTACINSLCACAADSFEDTVGTTKKCYKKIGAINCVDATAPCYTTATCSSDKACYCAAGKTPDANLQKCVTAGAADVVASILSLAVVVVTSRVL